MVDDVKQRAEGREALGVRTRLCVPLNSSDGSPPFQPVHPPTTRVNGTCGSVYFGTQVKGQWLRDRGEERTPVKAEAYESQAENPPHPNTGGDPLYHSRHYETAYEILLHTPKTCVIRWYLRTAHYNMGIAEIDYNACWGRTRLHLGAVPSRTDVRKRLGEP